MRYVLTFLSLMCGANAMADIGAVEGLKNLIKSSQESSAKNDFKGNCENLAKEYGPHEIIRKVADHQYLAGVRTCTNRSDCKWDDVLVVETESIEFSERTPLIKDLWVQRQNRKIKVKDEDGFDADYVVMKENFDCAVEGSIHVSGKHAIAFAAKDGNLALLKALEKKGQDINLEDDTGVSVLDIAQDKKRTAVVAYLKSKGAKNGSAKLTDAFVKALAAKNIKGATEIMKNGLNPNAKYDSCPMLYVVVRFGNLEMLKWLVEHGAKVNAEDDQGVTPLIVAASLGKSEMVSYLMSKGADVNHVGNDHRTPASEAKANGHKEILSMLKAAGAD